MNTPEQRCHICGTVMDQPGKPETRNCGGDCLRCLAECYDPDCMAVMREVEPDNPKWKGPD